MSFLKNWANLAVVEVVASESKPGNDKEPERVSVPPDRCREIEALERCKTFWAARVEHHLKQGLPEVAARQLATRETMPMFRAEDQRLIALRKKEEVF